MCLYWWMIMYHQIVLTRNDHIDYPHDGLWPHDISLAWSTHSTRKGLLPSPCQSSNFSWQVLGEELGLWSVEYSTPTFWRGLKIWFKKCERVEESMVSIHNYLYYDAGNFFSLQHKFLPTCQTDRIKRFYLS